jgi:hypothetical protein
VRCEDTSGVHLGGHPPLDSDPVEVALAVGLRAAVEAQQWDVVAQLAKELEARRTARTSTNFFGA